MRSFRYGVGISEKNKKVIFEEFRQGDSGLSRKFNGTGLGLTISKRYIDMMGGELTCDSTLGKGTSFKVFLPEVIIDRVERVTYEKINGKTESGSGEVHNSILIINSNPEMTNLMKDYLVSHDYEVFTASESATGLRFAVDKKPDTIAIDALLTDMEAWHLLKELRNEDTVNGKNIIYTSIVEEQPLELGFGVYEFILKPLSIEKLEDKVKRVCKLTGKEIKMIGFIDDNKLECENLSYGVKNSYKLTFIENDDSYPEVIEKTLPDLIIINFMMKRIDGNTLFYKLKQNKLTRNIPLIIYTGEELTVADKSGLNSIIREVSLKAKNHALDTLKLLKEKLNINDDENIKDSLIIEEGESEFSGHIEDHKVVARSGSSEPQILIVDDDKDTLYTVGEIVRNLGCKTIFARNGLECLMALKNVMPDIILLDIMMPQMDGFQTINRIRSNKLYSDLPIFALTAHAMLDNKEVIEKHGFNGIITKPINTASLAFKIQKTLRRN